MNHLPVQGPAFAEIDLEALQHNLSVVRRYAPRAKVMAVIKANAYGHGLVRIARALEDADALAVARVDEALRLRQAGIRRRIAVLQGFGSEEELQRHIDYDLEAVVHSFHQIDLLEHRDGRSALKIWLKIDTGMNRLGFTVGEAADVIQRVQHCTVVKQPFDTMTHLASADDPVNPFTARQIEAFGGVETPNLGERSIGNSAGLIGWPSTIADWVRPGLMLYGISPIPETGATSLGLKPVMSFHSRVISVKAVQAGETVGYGNSWVCPHDILLGVIAIGYGDGYPRAARPGTPVLVNGQRVPLVGRVSMDMLTVDLSSQPHVKPGDRATLWGKSLPVEDIAKHADTIPYTLVCGVTQRVEIVDNSSEAVPGHVRF